MHTNERGIIDDIFLFFRAHRLVGLATGLALDRLLVVPVQLEVSLQLSVQILAYFMWRLHVWRGGGGACGVRQRFKSDLRLIRQAEGELGKRSEARLQQAQNFGFRKTIKAFASGVNSVPEKVEPKRPHDCEDSSAWGFVRVEVCSIDCMVDNKGVWLMEGCVFKRNHASRFDGRQQRRYRA